MSKRSHKKARAKQTTNKKERKAAGQCELSSPCFSLSQPERHPDTRALHMLMITWPDHGTQT